VAPKGRQGLDLLNTQPAAEEATGQKLALLCAYNISSIAICRRPQRSLVPSGIRLELKVA
jgi:hypothetical protein